MKIKFTKMHGIGNDYIYIDSSTCHFKNFNNLAVKLSDRHFGVGADGLVLICKSKKADAKMRMFNADGSEGRMCGNAIRCVAKYLIDNKIVNKNVLKIETKSGIKNVIRISNNLFKVDMGKPKYDKQRYKQLLKIGKQVIQFAEISMGNPHAVIFPEHDVEEMDIKAVGSQFENHSAFPHGTNTEFANVIAPNVIKMRVWERGSGETLACGTGACAVAVACVLDDFCDRSKPIIVRLRGGELTIDYSKDQVYMTGFAEKVFEGQVEI